MIDKYKILGLIPARGGSKGVKKKNLVKIHNKSLTEWALINLIKTKYIDKIIVSTDNDEIYNLVNSIGEYTPFKRPKEFALDESKSIDVIKHALDFENKNNRFYDFIVLIEPSCPFRTPNQIEQCLEMISANPEITSVVSLVEVEDNHPIRMKKILPTGKIIPYLDAEPEGLRRQDQEKIYIRNGGVYVFNSKKIKKDILYGDNVHGLIVDRNKFGFNIDSEMDYELSKIIADKMKNKYRLKEILPI
tara:strand:+ start:242 stop:982 length:741 start_codon:yes stop_codon:yes gene_type:complete